MVTVFVSIVFQNCISILVVVISKAYISIVGNVPMDISLSRIKKFYVHVDHPELICRCKF